MGWTRWRGTLLGAVGLVPTALLVATPLPLARADEAQSLVGGQVVVVTAESVELDLASDAARLRKGDVGYVLEVSGERIARIEVQSVNGRRVRARLARVTSAVTPGLRAELHASGRSSNEAGEAPAPERLERACERGEAEACSSLGSSYAEGSGVARDDARASALFRQACQAGSRSGCARLAWLVDRLVDSGRRLLARAKLAPERAAYEEALRAFELALVSDPAHAAALAGRAEATSALDAWRERSAIALVQDETTFTPVDPSASAVAQLLIEAKPASVEVGQPFVLRYLVANLSSAPLPIGAVSVRNTLGGGVTGGSIDPPSRAVPAKGRLLLSETRLAWSWDPATEWTSMLTVVLGDGGVYSTAIRAERR